MRIKTNRDIINESRIINSKDGNECRLSWLLHKVKDIDVPYINNTNILQFELGNKKLHFCSS